jgi:hypothetical protein
MNGRVVSRATQTELAQAFAQRDWEKSQKILVDVTGARSLYPVTPTFLPYDEE